MKFLVDNALSPDVALALHQAGHDAIHVRNIDLTTASDEVIFDQAALEDRVIVSADTDFGTLLAFRHEVKPSLILFRGPISRKPAIQAHLILSNLTQVQDDLLTGAIVTIEPGRIRIRSLPI